MLTMDAIDSQMLVVTQTGKQIGKTRNEALVPLVFDQKGSLVTAEAYNAAIANDSADSFEVYFSDFKTYKKVMKELVARGKQQKSRLDKAQEKYTHALPLGKTSHDEISAQTVDELIYAYDPYETVHYSDEEMHDILENLPVEPKLDEDTFGTQDFGSTPAVWVADIAVQAPQWSTIWNTGHSGVVTQLNCGSLKCSGNPNLPATMVMEANKFTSETWDDLHEWRMLLNFDPAERSNTVYLLFVPNLTDTQIINIRNFARRQDPGTYNIFTTKDTMCDGHRDCTWYCSLLVWKAYQKYTGKNLDPGGGYWVWPFDLINSSHTRTYYSE